MIHLSNNNAVLEYLNDNDLIYYKMFGGLGNQLFCLSRAHLLSIQLDTKIAIDISSLDHTVPNGPEWQKWPELTDWCDLIQTSNELKLPTEIQNLDKPFDEISKQGKFYTGWQLSLAEITESGLFRDGAFPFEYNLLEESDVAIHIRGGDYRAAPGIGLLGLDYYKQAIKRLTDTEKSSLRVFTDDKKYSNEIIRGLKGGLDIKFSITESPVEVLYQLSKSPKLIGSNSTLSWWAAFFSNAREIFLPKPLYLQDWYADSSIILNKVTYIERFPNRLMRELVKIKWSYSSL